jgi:phytoene dehydrogenase-like protein
MSDQQLDAVIVGGGHNGLTCAAYLARAGMRVVVLEKADRVGGAAITEEFHPGFRNSVASYAVSLLDRHVIADLELARHGLRIVERPVANFWPIDAERSLLMPHGLEARQRAIAEFSANDAARLPAYDAALGRATAVLRDLVRKTPPNAGGGLVDLVKGAVLGRRLLGLDIEDQRLMADLFTKSVAEFLGQFFRSEIVKGALAFDGIVGAYVSPHTPGTAYVLLHHCFGEVNGKPGVWGHALGGMGAISDAMRRSAEASGATVRTNSPVRSVIVEAGRACGVVLEDGSEVRAAKVIANVGPKLLFRDLVPEKAVATAVRQRFLAMRTGSGTFRMNVALAELPDFTCRRGTHMQDHHASGLVIGPTIEYLDRAYLDARATGWSQKPVIEILVPSTLDDSLAPAGKHVASLFVQHVAPQLPHGRSWADPREAETFADLVIATVSEHAPNFARAVLGRQVLSPLDLERRFGLLDGDIFHGQLSLDQLFSTRPVLGHADYRMPVPGLYLCGSGGHPGGGVTGLPGYNAAREVLKDAGGASRLLRSLVTRP